MCLILSINFVASLHLKWIQFVVILFKNEFYLQPFRYLEFILMMVEVTMWCDVMWCVWLEERPTGDPYFFPHFVNKWKSIVWFGQLPFEKLVHYSDSDLISEPLTQKNLHSLQSYSRLANLPMTVVREQLVGVFPRGCVLFFIWFWGIFLLQM